MNITLTDNEGTVLAQWPLTDTLSVGKFEAILAHALSASDEPLSLCDDCGGFYPADDMTWDEKDLETYCPGCWAKREAK